MNQKLAYILFAFAFVVALVVGFGPREEERVAPETVRARVRDKFRKASESPAPADPLREQERSPSSESRSKAPTEKPMTTAALSKGEFFRKYGDRLRLTQFESRVVRIEGTRVSIDELESNQKLAGFRSSSSAALIARAREVLADSRALLGIADRVEFLEPTSNPGQYSGQVIFQQSIDGVPISPGGLVTIVFGSQGELRTIDSSIHPSVEVVNARQGDRPAYAREILYVTQSSPIALVHYAYETRDGGIQKIVDVQTQEILLERDRRIH